MALLEELKPGVMVKGLLLGSIVTLISVQRHDSIGVELVYKDAGGQLGSELLYSESIAHLEIAPAGLPWSFDADGALFRLTSEAYRIRLAYVEVDSETTTTHYITKPFQREPDFDATSVTYDLAKLLNKGVIPL